MATHFKGPILGAPDAAGGLYADHPIGAQSPGMFIEHFDDFNGLYFTEGFWTETAINGGPGTAFDFVDSSFRGILRMTTTTINTGSSMQPAADSDSSATIVALGAGQDFALEIGLTCDAWANSDWLIGACARGAVLSSAGAPVTPACDNFAGFRHLEAGSGVPILSCAGTAVANIQTVTSKWTTALTASTYYRFGIRISGLDRVRFYINREPVSDWTAMSTNFANAAALVPTVAMVANGAAVVVDWDYYHAIAERPY